jgi:hypothetical protein
MDGQQLPAARGPDSAQAGAGCGPFRRPGRWLLGCGPRWPCGGRPWAVFTSRPNTSLNSTSYDFILFIFSEAHLNEFCLSFDLYSIGTNEKIVQGLESDKIASE